MAFMKMTNRGWVESLTKQFSAYEKRAKQWVETLDLRTRDARKQSLTQLDRFNTELKKRRSVVEKRMKTLFNQESRWLNDQVFELVKYVKSVALSEKATPKNKARAKRTTSTKKKARRSSTSKKQDSHRGLSTLDSMSAPASL